MKRLFISAIAVAGLAGCASYDYVGGSPGGYYRSSPVYEYAYPNGDYGAYGGNYGYGFWGGYGGYGGWPWYDGGYRHRDFIRAQPHRPRGGDDGHHRPPGDGHRPPGGQGPWHLGRGQRPPDDGGRAHSDPLGRSHSPGDRPMPPRPASSRPARPAHFRNRPIDRER